MLRMRIQGRRFYQWGGGGRLVLQFMPSFWQLGQAVVGAYRHMAFGPFILAVACGKGGEKDEPYYSPAK